jgi:hypothetical protein
MNPFVSQAEFARYRGCSRFAVTHWKRLGLLVMRDGLVDVEASEKLIDARPEKFRGGVTNRRKAGPKPSKPASPRKAKHAATEALATIAPVVEAALDKVLPEAASWTTAEAARRKEIALALTRQLEYDLKAANVVEISKVVETVQGEYAVLRDRALQMPGKLADRVTGRIDRHEVEKIIKAEVFEMLTALSARAVP